MNWTYSSILLNSCGFRHLSTVTEKNVVNKTNAVVPEVWTADPFQGDPWIHICNGYFEVCFFNTGIIYCWKWPRNFFNWRYVNFVWPLEHLIKKPPVPKKRLTVIKVKSGNTLLPMILECIRRYVKSFLRYKFLIFGTYRLDTLYYREQGCEGSWLFFETERGPTAKKLGKYWPNASMLLQWRSPRTR